MNGIVGLEAFLMVKTSLRRAGRGPCSCIVASMVGMSCVPDAKLNPSCEPAAGGDEELLYGFDADTEGFFGQESNDSLDLTKRAAIGWADVAGANGTPGALRIVAPFDSYNQYVAVETTAFEQPVDYSTRLLRACVKIEGTFSPDVRAPGEAVLYVKTVPGGYFWGQSLSTRILPSSFGEWLPVEFELDNPQEPAVGYSADEIEVIGVSIRTGSGDTGPMGIASEAPGPTIAYVDQITVVSP